MGATESDVSKGKRMEKNTQDQGKGAPAQVRKEGMSKNPTKGGGINRSTSGEYKS